MLLGANGAGKTTAIRLITGALHADTGLVRVFGQDPASVHGEEIRRRCGVVSAKPSLYDRLNGWDNLRYAAELFGLGRGPDTDRKIGNAAEKFDIGDSLDLMVGGYSTGMKTRLALSRAVLHDPDLLLLDEPTSGLDPESAAAVLELIRAMTSDGRTVLMCTHLLLEAEGLADRVVIMEHGSTIVSGAPDDLAQQYWPQPLVRIASDPEADVTILDTLSAWTASRPLNATQPSPPSRSIALTARRPDRRSLCPWGPDPVGRALPTVVGRPLFRSASVRRALRP